MALDGYSAFALKVHVVEHLPVCDLNCVGKFEQAVSQSRLAVVNVGYDAKVSNILHIYNYVFDYNVACRV
jgi:hypothetical protein